jgi:hypothetical protein
MSEKNDKPTPSPLKTARDALLTEINQLLVDAKALGPVQRSYVLHEVADAIAALETSQAAYVRERTEQMRAETERLREQDRR